MPDPVAVYKCCDFGDLHDRFLANSLLYQGSANFFCKGPISKYFWLYSIRSPLQLLNCIENSHRRQYVNKWVCPDLAIILVIVCWSSVCSTISLISLKSHWFEEALCIFSSFFFLTTVAVSKHFINSAVQWLSDLLWSWLTYWGHKPCGLLALNTTCHGERMPW